MKKGCYVVGKPGMHSGHVARNPGINKFIIEACWQVARYTCLAYIEVDMLASCKER
jgi:hypothetical protein